MAETQAPGLRWRATHGGKTPIWRASKSAIRAGYPVKSVNLATFADNERMLRQRCDRLQAEMLDWMSGRRERPMTFNGTFASLISIYQRDPESPYRNLRPSSRHPYDVYCRMLTVEIGARRIDACDGRDVKRWFKAWSDPVEPGGRPRLAAARMAIVVIKTALSFGKACRLPGCAEFKTTIEDIRFKAPVPRQVAPIAADIVRARAVAHQISHSAAALAYALQFEGGLRQWDVIGQWVPLDDPRPSAIIDGRSKWIGPMWSQIDDSLVLHITPSKTEGSSQARVLLDLSSYPMVVEELARITQATRKGPLIVNPRTALPYRQWYFRDLWRRVATQAGISDAIWNRDLRAGAVTEARQAGAPTDDVAKTAGHSNKRTTARVYDRDTLEAARRVAKARSAYRSRNEA
jgi:integrase